MNPNYKANAVDANGVIDFTDEENLTWAKLIENQLPIVHQFACEQYLSGLEKLKLPLNRAPHLFEVNEALEKQTSWNLQPVASVIGPKDFFGLLAKRKFPCATFIRRKEDFYYIKEPDIFHEIFGHCPMLTHQPFAQFVERYGQFALKCPKASQKYLFRLFWFTVEFGLINTSNGKKIYGGGILSSIGETKSALTNNNIQYEIFDILKILRTPYRIDLAQKLYFVIEDFNQLYHCVNDHLFEIIEKAKEEGDLKPLFALLNDQGEELEYTN